MKKADLLLFIGGPNAYYVKLAKPLGGVSAAILFSQLFYWQDKASSHLGVYKTRAELEIETGLTHNEQRTAIKKLIEKEIITVTEKRLEHKTYYKVNYEKLHQLLSGFPVFEMPLSQYGKACYRDNTIITTEKNANSTSLKQKSTSKNTAEITANLLIVGKSVHSNRGCPVPTDFRPTKFHYDLADHLFINLDNELPHFKDHYLARGAIMKDWNAAFNTWLRNAAKFKKSLPKPLMTLSERNRAVFKEL